MSEIPEPREQIAGLTFALLLLRPDLTVDQVNPAAESLIGRSARRLLGKKFLDMVSFAEGRISEVIGGSDATRSSSARMLWLWVFWRMLLICVRTVETATPQSRATSFGRRPRHKPRSTLASAPVRPWVRA